MDDDVEQDFRAILSFEDGMDYNKHEVDAIVRALKVALNDNQAVVFRP